MEAHTIPEAVTMLETAIGAVLPGFKVSVSINLTSSICDLKTPVEDVETDVEDVSTSVEEDEGKSLTLDDIRNMLNAYSKAAGKEKAFELVGKFTNGGKNPADIKPVDYPKVIAGMGGFDLNPKGDK